jgi:hypothetical protein
MRLVLAMVLAVSVGLPLGASAQAASEDSLSSWQVEAKPAPEEPALELKLDDDSVKITPGAYRAPTVEEMEMERRARRAKVGLGVSVPFMAYGAMMTGLGASPLCFEDILASPGEETCPDSVPGLLAAGIVVLAGSLGGTIASSILLRQRKRTLSELQQAHYGIPARTRLGYTPEEAQLRVKRARIGLGVSAGITVLGVAFVTAGSVGQCRDYAGAWVCQGGDCWQIPPPSWCQPLTIAGATFTATGVAGMITAGFLSLRRTRDRDWLRQGRPRRVQWDLAQSRLVF